MTAGTQKLHPALPRIKAESIALPSRAIAADAPNTPASFAKRAYDAAAGLPSVVLLSGTDHPCSRRSYAALKPAMIFESKNGRCRLLSARGAMEFDADPFETLGQLLAHWWIDDAEVGTPIVAGYVAYEAGRAIEVLPGRATDALALPDIWMCCPTELRLLTHGSMQEARFEIRWSDEIGILPPLSSRDNGMRFSDTATPRVNASPGTTGTTPDAKRTADRTFDRESYAAAVERVRAHIYEGDVYQVNLSQRYRFPLLEDAFSLWLKLFGENPAPFYAWIDAGDHQILSTSMERFFRIDGERIETRPIKGTRPRGANEEEAQRFAAELLSSEKDDAELSMIVDLERNDLGKICGAGSVRVAAHKQIERYANVQHLVSVVEGTLLPGTGIAEIFRALFPGGSITGCPKIRAMEIIDAIEAETRHAYTGSIGFIAADGSADFNIAIRTAIVRDGMCNLSVGGGIVYDSDPLEEYFETLHKGRTFFQLAGISSELDSGLAPLAGA
ncbi:MAG: anthranilate synthase component I family protein [Bacteroidetes bacterium]|nr:anthranilate synthase component I family protein [Bacteroidota bacterium]